MDQSPGQPEGECPALPFTSSMALGKSLYLSTVSGTSSILLT